MRQKPKLRLKAGNSIVGFTVEKPTPELTSSFTMQFYWILKELDMDSI